MKQIELKRRTEKVFRSKYAFPISGIMSASYKVKGLRDEETTQKGFSGAINMSDNIIFMLENIRIQCAFGHLKDVDMLEFYPDSDTVVDDIGDNLKFELHDYIFEYPLMNGERKYKFITVKNKRYLQEFQRVGNKFIFRRRFKVEGIKTKQKKSIEMSKEL